MSDQKKSEPTKIAGAAYVTLRGVRRRATEIYADEMAITHFYVTLESGENALIVRRWEGITADVVYGTAGGVGAGSMIVGGVVLVLVPSVGLVSVALAIGGLLGGLLGYETVKKPDGYIRQTGEELQHPELLIPSNKEHYCTEEEFAAMAAEAAKAEKAAETIAVAEAKGDAVPLAVVQDPNGQPLAACTSHAQSEAATKAPEVASTPKAAAVQTPDAVPQVTEKSVSA